MAWFESLAPNATRGKPQVAFLCVAFVAGAVGYFAMQKVKMPTPSNST